MVKLVPKLLMNCLNNLTTFAVKLFKMTIKEYCSVAGVTKPAVSYRLKNKMPLPGIISIEYIDGEYSLTPGKDFSAEKIKILFRRKRK